MTMVLTIVQARVIKKTLQVITKALAKPISKPQVMELALAMAKVPLKKSTAQRHPDIQ